MLKTRILAVARFDLSTRLDYKLGKRKTNFLEFPDGLAARIRSR
jgi:hypothetical protein